MKAKNPIEQFEAWSAKRNNYEYAAHQAMILRQFAKWANDKNKKLQWHSIINPTILDFCNMLAEAGYAQPYWNFACDAIKEMRTYARYRIRK